MNPFDDMISLVHHLGVLVYSRVLFGSVNDLRLEVYLSLDLMFGDEVEKLLVDEGFCHIEVSCHFGKLNCLKRLKILLIGFESKLFQKEEFVR